MKNLNILIVEGNVKEENQNFLKVGIQTHTESLKDSLNGLNNYYDFFDQTDKHQLQSS